MDEQLLQDVTALVAAAEESDGNPPLSEQTLVTLRAAAPAHHSLLTLALYAPEEDSGPGDRARTWPDSPSSSRRPDGTGVLEVAVHPSYRNQGVADRLVGELPRTRGLRRAQGLVPRQP